MNARDAARCEEARRLLWPRDLPREHSEGVERARRHLEECGDCRAFFRRDEALAGAVRRHGGRTVGAPKELRERVYDALARERTFRASSAEGGVRGLLRSFASRGARAVAAAAFLVAVVLATVLLTDGSGAGDEYVQDFASRAVEEDVIRTSDPVDVTRFFMREMGMSLPPVALEDAELSRAMICLIRGERAAMVEYEWRGHTVAHYRLPLSGGARPASAGTRLRTAAERGVHVVRWQDGEFEHAVVSELPDEELLRLVRSRFVDF